MSALINELEKQAQNHEQTINELERRNIIKKEQLKSEMIKKIREAKLNLLAMTEDKLHTTTKRTIKENEKMTTELHYQSRETEKILRQNVKLVRRVECYCKY
jgi:hypothetical protein